MGNPQVLEEVLEKTQVGIDEWVSQAKDLGLTGQALFKWLKAEVPQELRYAVSQGLK